LINGEVFDSTSKTGKPATFKLSQVIPGWIEALQLMPAGSTWEVYVPASLAYGDRSVGGPIGPNETLIFNIHLVSVKKSEA
jgi:FKBP-type peptidyl-prolyl cis-trans isomerase FklB